MTQEIERWEDINGFPTYQVSTHGRVKRLQRPTCSNSLSRKDRKKFWPEKLISIRLRAGYPSVSMLRKDMVVHRLMGKAFLPNPNNLPCINHIDGDKTNNRLSNLEWCTVSENTRHAYDLGLAKSGESNIRAKLKNDDVIEIRRLHSAGLLTPTQLGKKYGVLDTCIGNLLSRRTWKRI